MARKIKNSYACSRVCGLCGKEFKFAGPGSANNLEITSSMVDHFESKHPDRMAYCFDTYRQTWNSQYDACLKALHHTTGQRDAAIKERDAAAAQQRSLAAKLNAIVLILRND